MGYWTNSTAENNFNNSLSTLKKERDQSLLWDLLKGTLTGAALGAGGLGVAALGLGARGAVEGALDATYPYGADGVIPNVTKPVALMTNGIQTANGGTYRPANLREAHRLVAATGAAEGIRNTFDRIPAEVKQKAILGTVLGGAGTGLLVSLLTHWAKKKHAKERLEALKNENL